jgi:hypothetical protein
VDTAVRRWVAYGGLLFVLIVVVAVVVAPNAPSSNATAAKVVSNYHNHQAAYYVSAYLIVLAVIEGLTYFWYLREYLGQVAASRRLLTVAYAGAVLFGISGTVGAGLNIALADGGHHANFPAASMQTLNLLKNDLNIPIAAAGTATFLLVTALVVLRNGGLPRWLGWAGIVLGVISATGIVGPAGVGLWVLLTSITLLLQGRRNAGLMASTAST